jgi:hypothetical protein
MFFLRRESSLVSAGIRIFDHPASSLVSIPTTLLRLAYSNPITGLDRPLGSQEVEAPRFLDNRHMKVVRLSAVRTGRLYPPGKIPGTHFC